MAEESKTNNRGGARKGAGRKPKLDEEKTRGLSLSAIKKVFGSEDKAWERVAQLANEGSFKHLELLYGYAYGKPKDNVDITSQGEAMNVISLGNGIKPDESTS